jgi:hypothetical protein
MSWTSLHLEHDDEIRPTSAQAPGYVQLNLGKGITLMAPIAKAAELQAVLGEALAEQSEGGAS